MIEIIETDFDACEILRSLQDKHAGALVTFIGTVRGSTSTDDKKGPPHEVEVKELSYECYKEMALEKMAQIRDHVIAQYDIKDIHLIHRTGVLRPTEQIVMIAVGAAHRKEAFKACEYAIDEVKKSVPIWKKEITQEGEYWVEGDEE